jgi:hypothetical protein
MEQSQFTANTDINAPTAQQQNAERVTPASRSDASNPDFKMAMKFYSIGKQARKKYDQDWEKQKRWYNGNQWDWRRPSYKASPALNIIRPTIQTMLPILTDTSPTFDVMPMEPLDYDFADMLNKLVDNWWQRRNIQLILTTALLDMMIYDAAGILKCVWNDDIDGIGDIEVTRIDPNNIFVDDDATDFTDAKFVVEEKWLPISTLKIKFPDKADVITGCRAQTDPKKNSESSAYSGQVTLQSPIDQDVPLQSSGEQDKNISGSGMEAKSVKVLDIWIRDETLDEIAASNGKKIYKKRYPRGKLITIIPDSGILLQSVDNPYGDGRFPYIRFVNAIRSGIFWGEGEVGCLIETQKMLNKCGATIIDWCNRMTNSVWVLDDDSGVNPAQITNQVGLILTKKRGTNVDRLPAPPLPSEVFELYQTLLRLAEQQSGVHDVTQGRKPTGITAAAAISEMQEAAQTRLRIKERNMQAGLVQLGYMIVSRMLQFYTTPRTVRITGKQGWPEFYEVFFSKEEQQIMADGGGEQPEAIQAGQMTAQAAPGLPPEQGPLSEGQPPDVEGMPEVKKETYSLHSRVYQFAPETRQYVPVTDWQQTEGSKGEFDIQVQAGTSLPFMKQKRSDLAFQLFKVGAIDQEALLEAVDWPNYQQTMRRMQEQAQAAQQAQAAMPGAGGAPPQTQPAEVQQ